MQTLKQLSLKCSKYKGQKREFWQKTENYENNQIKTLEMKNAIAEIKNLMANEIADFKNKEKSNELKIF